MKILKYTIDYLKKTEPGFVFDSWNNVFTCIKCHEMSATLDSEANISCPMCGNLGNIVDILIKKNIDNPEGHIIKVLGLSGADVVDVETIFKFYKNNHFDLVPLLSNSKIPIEYNWPNKEHTSVEEWDTFIQDSMNLGIKTGRRSDITVIDIDQRDIPAELEHFLGQTCYQKTNKGWHFFYKYEKDLPKTRIDKYKLDIVNDGGQVVCSPSIVDGIVRNIMIDDVIKMPEELKNILLSNITTRQKTYDEPITEESIIKNLGTIKEGDRNKTFMHIGGILRKDLNIDQTALTLRLMNRYFCEPQLDSKEFSNIIQSLSKYDTFDEQYIADRVLRYMRIVEEASARDIKEALGFPKELVDRVMS